MGRASGRIQSEGVVPRANATRESPDWEPRGGGTAEPKTPFPAGVVRPRDTGTTPRVGMSGNMGLPPDSMFFKRLARESAQNRPEGPPPTGP